MMTTTDSTPAERAVDGFTDAERAAMKERAHELKTSARRTSAAEKAAAAERDVLEKIAEMAEGDRVIAERFHALVREVAPALAAKTWYGMPAYTKGGKVVCFFKAAGKFDSRYATIGFEETAALDDGNVWPTSYAVTRLTAADEEFFRALVARAAG